MDNALNTSDKKTKNNKYCLNCGSKLRGYYCHNCGQRAKDSNITVMSFVMEYIYNAFMWDPKFFKTLKLLICKPGALTKQFLSGKYVSQVHPLKLNMFMLFVFITMFMFFSGKGTTSSPVATITNDEKMSSILHIGLIADNEEYSNKLQSSPRDTVKLLAPLLLAENFPDIAKNVGIIEDTKGESLDKWLAVIPTILIEDSIVSPNADGYYCFEGKSKELEMIEVVWAKTLALSTRFFPLIVLFTAPFLSFSLRLAQYRKKSSSINRFIFSLHYTAFLELFIIFIYLLYLIAEPSIPALQLLLLASSGIYLTIAFRRVYDIESWFKAGFKALYASVSYLMIILLAFIIVFIIAVFAALPQL